MLCGHAIAFAGGAPLLNPKGANVAIKIRICRKISGRVWQPSGQEAWFPLACVRHVSIFAEVPGGVRPLIPMRFQVQSAG
eukprot:6070405-Pyramimonas_sp.AAC.1